MRRKVKKGVVKKKKILTEEKVDYNAREIKEFNPEDSVLNKKGRVDPGAQVIPFIFQDFFRQCV